MRKFGKGDLAIITACFLMGLGTVIIKNVLGDTPDRLGVFVFNGLRLPAMGAMLLAAERLLGNCIRIDREDRRYFAWLGLLGFVNMLAFMFGLKMTTASNTGIIMATVPLFILLVAFCTKIERPSRELIVGIAVGFVGALILNFRDGTFALNLGDMLILAACLLMAIFTVFAKRMLDKYNPLTTAGWIFLIMFLFQLPLFLLELPRVAWSAVSSETWINFGIALIGPLLLTNALYYYALKKIGPSRVGIYNNLTPVFTLFLALAIRNESISYVQLAGLAIILAGITITKLEGFSRPVKKPLL